jgi:predicted amidophosphoribosyltransferase
MGDVLRMCPKCGIRPAGDGDFCTECYQTIRQEKKIVVEYVCMQCGKNFTSYPGETQYCPYCG